MGVNLFVLGSAVLGIGDFSLCHFAILAFASS
jgi:hypothetical protein